VTGYQFAKFRGALALAFVLMGLAMLMMVVCRDWPMLPHRVAAARHRRWCACNKDATLKNGT